MKETVLICCKYVLFAAALIPFLVIAYVMFPLLTWTWRIGTFLPFLVILLWGALQLLKNLVDRRRKRVAAPAPLEEANEAALARAEQDRLQELQRCWMEGISRLRGSHLKEEGNPHYVLPWFLVIGEAGSGKSAALDAARLCSPFAGREGAVGATGSCEWRFYDRGIVIDTAGRYTVPATPEADDEEWRRLLWLLRKYRRKEPMNGVILTIPADRLLKGEMTELEEYGRRVRLRMDDMARRFGVLFPVYLLVTKCDLVGGMTGFIAKLPKHGLDQPMGLLNEDRSVDVAPFLERFWNLLDGRLRALRLLVLHGAAALKPDADVLMFPDELRSLRPALQAFMHTAFEANHYQETPFLRGIYLSSAGQLGVNGAEEGQGDGAFLHDLFEKVLPGDRWLGSPTQAAAARRQRLAMGCIAAGVACGISLCLLLTVSFMKNLEVIRQVAVLAESSRNPGGGATPGVASLEEVRAVVSTIEQQNREWWGPRFGLDRSKKLEEDLKARYCSDFRDRFLLFLDRDLSAAVGGLSAATPDGLFGNCVVHISRRCNLIKARLDGDGPDALAAKPLPAYPSSTLPSGGAEATTFGTLYLSYLAWNPERKSIDEELKLLQSLLKQALSLKVDYAWMLGLAELQETAGAITLQQFWHGSRRLVAEPVISPAFTRHGYEAAASLFSEITAAAEEADDMEKGRELFRAWYRELAFSAWQRFAWQLPTGELLLSGSKEWRAAAERMAGEQGPYFLFMKKSLAELAPFPGQGDLPSWISQLHRFQALKASRGGTGLASSMESARRKLADRLEKVGDEKGDPLGRSAVDATRQYLDAVAQLAQVAKSRTLAYQMAQQAFSESGEVGKSPLFQAVDAAQRLNVIVGSDDATFSRLVSGPITFYGTYIRMETACALQAQWEEKVLKEVQGESDPQTIRYLLGKDGPVWKYVGDFADPFLGWSPGRGYYAKTALGGAIPFRPEFYTFLARGARTKVAAATQSAASYQVSITGLPTDANAEARVKPQVTRLELNCATGPQTMINMNYPVSKPFVWSPQVCGDVLLQIEVGDTVLTRRYQGVDGFPAFLRDFPGGSKTFHSRQFPRQREALEKMGVRFVRVNYRLAGTEAIGAVHPAPLPARIPATIADCWD